jgi:hypothetical protein
VTVAVRNCVMYLRTQRAAESISQIWRRAALEARSLPVRVRTIGSPQLPFDAAEPSVVVHTRGPPPGFVRLQREPGTTSYLHVQVGGLTFYVHDQRAFGSVAGAFFRATQLGAQHLPQIDLRQASIDRHRATGLAGEDVATMGTTLLRGAVGVGAVGGTGAAMYFSPAVAIALAVAVGILLVVLTVLLLTSARAEKAEIRARRGRRWRSCSTSCSGWSVGVPRLAMASRSRQRPDAWRGVGIRSWRGDSPRRRSPAGPGVVAALAAVGARPDDSSPVLTVDQRLGEPDVVEQLVPTAAPAHRAAS